MDSVDWNGGMEWWNGMNWNGMASETGVIVGVFNL